MTWFRRSRVVELLPLVCMVPLLLTAHTCSASAMLWPGDDASSLTPLPPASAALDIVDMYASPDSFTPLDLSLDDPTSAPTTSHAFTPLSLNLEPPSASDEIYHHFLALGATAGYDESFHMSGAYHTLPSASPATFTDVAMSIRETAVDDDGGAGVQYGGVLSMSVRCGSDVGSLTLLYNDGVVIEDGDAVADNDTFTFTNVTFTASLVVANAALSTFTFIPASSSVANNVSCSYLVLTNQSLYTGQFTFDVASTPLPAPAATVARVSFNLSLAPNATELYALYTGLAADVADVLSVSAARVQLVAALVDVPAAETAVVMDFLPVGWHVMQTNQNSSVAALVAAFIALTPVQLSQTRWMRYVQPDSISQLCSDGMYRTRCVVVAAATAAAATAVTSSLAFIVAMSVGGTVLVSAMVAAGWRYAVKRRQSEGPPLSPLLKASGSEEALAAVHPIVQPAIDAALESPAVALDAVSVALHDPMAAVPDEDDDGDMRPRRSSRSSLPSARRASKRRSLVQFAPPQPGGAARLEMDVQGRLRYGGLGEGRRYVYQPQLVVNDARTAETRQRRLTLVQQMEDRHRERAESARGSLITDTHLSPDTQSNRSYSLSPLRDASMAAAASSLPALSAMGGRRHLHYVDDDDSEDDGDDQYTDGPKFIDASTATASASPHPQPLTAFTSPSILQTNALTAVVPSFPHPSTFLPLPARIESKRSSPSMAHRSISGGLMAQLAGEVDAFDGLHVGNGGEGSGANTPSLSTQDIANEWLQEDDTDGLDRLEQGSPNTLPRSQTATPQPQQWGGLWPAESLPSHEAKRGDWARDNLKRQSLSAKRASGRAAIILDLSHNALNTQPAMPQNSNDKAKSAAAPASTGSLWSKLGLASGGGQRGGVVKETMPARPLMRPLMANAPLHHPRLSLYQQRAVY